MESSKIAELVSQLVAVIRHKDAVLAAALQRTIPSLLKHPSPIDPTTPDRLLNVKGIGPVTLEWIERLLAGDSIEAIAADVPGQEKTTWHGEFRDVVGGGAAVSGRPHDRFCICYPCRRVRPTAVDGPDEPPLQLEDDDE